MLEKFVYNRLKRFNGRHQEHALRESEHMLRMALSAAHLGVFDWDVVTDKVSWENERIYEILGHVPENMPLSRQDFYNEHLFLEDQEEFEQKLNESLIEKKTFQITCRIKRKNDGKQRWIEISGQFYIDNSYEHLIGVVDDITERHQAEEGLRESEERYRQLVETASEGIWQIDNELRTIDVNERMAQMLGYTREEMIGHYNHEFMPAGEVADVRRRIEDRRRGVLENYERQLVRKDGAQICALVSVAQLRNREGDIIGSFGMFTDITRRKQVEDRLKETEQRLLVATKAAELGIYELDVKSGDFYWDQRIREIWGISPEEPIIYQVFITGLHPDDRTPTELAMDKAFDPEGNGRYAAEYRVINRIDGTTHWVLATGQVYFENKKAVRLVGIVQDISDRKKAENDIRESEHRLLIILEQIPVGIGVIDINGQLTLSNSMMKKYIQRTAYSQEDASQMDRWFSIYVDDNRPIQPHDCPGARALRGEMVYPGEEYAFEDVEGNRFWTIVSAAPFKSGEKIIGAIISIKDITYRKRAEDDIKEYRDHLEEMVNQRTSELEESRDFLNRIINSAGNPIFVKDRMHRWILLNDAYCDFMGYKREDLIGKSDFDFFPQKEAEIFWKFDELVFSSHQTNVNEEAFTDHQGVRRTILTKKVFWKDRSDQEFLVGIITDITDRKKMEDELDKHRLHLEELVQQRTSDLEQEINERKRIEQALREAEQKYRELIRYAPTAIYEIDYRDKRFISVNDAMCDMLGYTREELLAMDPSDLMDDDGRRHFEARVNQWLNRQEPDRNIEYKIKRKDGETITVILEATFTADENGKPLGATVVGHDITQRKIDEEKLKREKDAFENLVKDRTQELLEAHLDLERARRLSDIGTLASTVAHELRNPLAAINMASANIGRKVSDTRINENLSSINRKVQESERIVSNLLFYSRLRPPDLGRIKPYDIIQESVNEVSMNATKRVKIIISGIEAIKDKVIDADSHQLKEVILNLLNNSYDAVDNETGCIKLSAHMCEDIFKFCVCDNGHGMKKEMIEKITDPFFTTKAKGTGLGLTVCNQIITFHGGSLDIKSEEGKGTAIIVSLPAFHGSY